VHRVHEIGHVLKTSVTKECLAQAFPLDLEFVCAGVVVLGIASGLRHVKAPSPLSNNGKVNAWFHHVHTLRETPP
jgi:hypothetical protein